MTERTNPLPVRLLNKPAVPGTAPFNGLQKMNYCTNGL